MKLGKEEIQRLALGLLMLIAMIYSYFALLLGPLKLQQANTQKAIQALGPQIDTANAQIRKAQTVEQNAPAARATLDQINSMIPDGSPVAWFPPQIAEFFKTRGVEKAATRMNNEFPEKDLPGFRRIAWSIDLPRVGFIAFASALAELENEEPLLEVTAIQLDTSREDVESQRALLTVSNIVKQ
jgi:ABC-type Fe3+-siderophore transport system permease subunit